LYSSYPTDRIKTMFGSSLPLPPVVCRSVHVLFVLFMFVCLFVYRGVQHTLCPVLFSVFLCFVCFSGMSIFDWLPLRYSQNVYWRLEAIINMI